MEDTLKTVPMEFRIEQKEDITAYSGYFTLGGVTFDFVFSFPYAAAQFDRDGTLGEGEDPPRVNVKVSKGRKPLSLTESEIGFFTQLLLDLFLAFYQDPKTQRVSGMNAEAVKALMSATLTTAVTSRCQVKLTAEQCRMLKSSKFACVFE